MSRSSAAVLGAVFTVTFATAASTQSPAPAAPPSVQWVQTPSATLDPLNWPERALRLERNGQATLRCAHDAQGVLSDCRVVDETPMGFAFGQAALRMAKVFRLKPTLSDGSALAPGEVTFPVDFNAADFRDPRVRGAPPRSIPAAPSSATPARLEWVTPPSGGTNWREWPAPALRLEISGSATLKCKHDDQGQLSGCAVIDESRPLKGFGDAALRLARTFRLKPTLSDGSPLTAGEITFKVPFDYDGLR